MMVLVSWKHTYAAEPSRPPAKKIIMTLSSCCRGGSDKVQETIIFATKCIFSGIFLDGLLLLKRRQKHSYETRIFPFFEK